MRHTTILILFVTLALFTGCRHSGFNESPSSASSRGELKSDMPVTGTAGRVVSKPAQQGQHGQQAGEEKPAFRAPQQTSDSISSASASQASSQAIERKIIRNGELTLELDSPEEAQRRIAVIAEKHGGFVVNSESKRNDGNLQTAARVTITIVARVPASKFIQVMEEIQQTGSRVVHSKETGQDVTEEFIDLEAHIRAKRALEAQFLEIMKRAQKVSDALEVQTQLAEVRGDIEQMEGRRRFLENQAALSTITITLQTPTPIVAATTGGFWHSIKLAFGEGLDTAADIVLGLIRFVIVMIPVVLLIVLPLWLAVRWLRRRVDWPKRAAATAATNAGE